MARILLYIASLLVILKTANSDLVTNNGTITITVGTTSRCPDAANFITQQLVPAYEKYGRFLYIEFVPWGRTVLHENGAMTCQFGPNDCWANRVQRCALYMLRGNQEAQLSYMNCEFSAPLPSWTGSYLCAQAANINLIQLDYCVSTTGYVLDLASQEAAREPMSIINFVPSIHFNGNIDVALHRSARQRLVSMICFALAEDPSTGVTDCQI